MDNKKFGNWPEPESEKARDHRKELSEMEDRAIKVLSGWIVRKAVLEVSLENARAAGNKNQELDFQERLENAKKNIDEGVEILRGVNSEFIRDEEVRKLLEEAVKKVKGGGAGK